jgi:anthranilate/para-aminobenzoate synthase component I
VILPDLIVRDVAAPWAELVLRLARAPGAFFLRHREHMYCGAFPAQVSSAVDPTDSVVQARGDVLSSQEDRSGLWAGLPHWVGVLPYEGFRSIERGGGIKGDLRPAPSWCAPRWARYAAVAQLHDQGAQIVGETRADVERLTALLSQNSPPTRHVSLDWATRPEATELHRRRIEQALAAISRGELYQVNLARRFDFRVFGNPFELLLALESSGPAPFGAVMNFQERSVVSLSPELFLDVDRGGRVVTRPIKGTRPRGMSRDDDHQQQELENSPKERAELTMVIDIERNDLGRLAVPGSVRMVDGPRVVRYPTVLHREAEIEAQLYPACSYRELLATMCPSGSVTGAPKVSAMDWIARLESARRGLYTGALGFIARDGALRLSMAIRTLTIDRGVAHYFTGGGIVADSDPDQEIQETLWKAEQLGHLVQLGQALL